MKEIQLSKTFQKVQVDDSDFEQLNQHAWMLQAGYAARASKSHAYMHHFLCPTDKGFVVDHVDGNKLNNQRSNLRAITQKDNLSNRGVNKNNKSGYKGVYLHCQNKTWIASIMVNIKGINLGSFKNKDDAARCYNEAATKFFGVNTKLNQITAKD